MQTTDRARSTVAVALAALVAAVAVAAFGAPATASPPAVAVAPAATAAVAMPGPLGALDWFGFDLGAPGQITVAGDGSAWFRTGFGLGRTAPDGSYRQYVAGGDMLAPGPGADIWSASLNSISRISPDGSVMDVLGTGGFDGIEAITSDAAGNLWLAANAYFDIIPAAIVRVTPAGVVTVFNDPDLILPETIAVGSDGNVWFTDNARVGRMTPAGVMSFFAIPGNRYAVDLTAHSDGNVWFTTHDDLIGRVTPAGVIDLFVAAGLDVPTDLRHSIVSGSDGNIWVRSRTGPALVKVTPAGVASPVAAPGIGARGALASGAGDLWFTDLDGDAVGRVSATGAVTVLPPPDLGPYADLTAGPDGNVWVTSPETDTVARVGADRDATVFAGPGIDDPAGIVTGADGNLWFANTGNDSITRLTPAGVMTNHTGPGIDGPTGVELGSDGNVWFLNDGNGTVGRITPAGAVTTFAASGIDELATGHGVNDITAAPDGSLWFTSAADDRVGRITTAGAVTWIADAALDAPRMLAAAPNGNVFVVNRIAADDSSIVMVTPNRAVVTVVDAFYLAAVSDIELGVDGAIWYPGAYNVIRLAPDGSGVVPALPFPASAMPVQGKLAAGPEGAMWFTQRGSTQIGRMKAIVDGAPTYPVAIAGRQQATVTWQPPVTPAGPITGYTVVASPGGASCSTSGAGRSCVVTGLAAGVAHSFSVRATGAGGPGPSVLTAPVTPFSGSRYHPVVPDRILDSRLPDEGFRGPVTSQVPRSLQITGLGGASNVPASATAVVMNVTVTDSTAESFLTVYPTGSPRPNASNLNFGAGQVIPNLVTVKLGTGGRVDIATAVGSTDVVADVVGYYDDGGGSAGGGFVWVEPERLLDSREPASSWGGKLAAGTPRDLAVTEPARNGGVPQSATAVVVNITVTGGTAPSFVSAWPTGESQPGVSNLNLLPGQTIPNLAVVKVGAGGSIRLANAVGSVDVIVDLIGYFVPDVGAWFHPLEPNRILDTRTGTGLSAKQGAGQVRNLAVAGAPGTGVPNGAIGLVVNVTVADATAESFVTVFPSNVVRPDPFSNLNFGINQVIPNLATVGVAPDGTIGFYNHLGETHLVGDAVGWYAPW